MTSIGDSSAVKIEDRVLPQHQAALTILQRHISAPGVEKVAWLDLACGRGQILGGLDENLSAEGRHKVDYWAYDVNQEYAREASRTASGLGFAGVNVSVGDLGNFNNILPEDIRYDFVTLTNTVHEVAAVNLAQILVATIHRLSAGGTAFIYDMERINPPELGAIPWDGGDFRAVALTVLEALGEKTYQPEVGRWRHRTVNGWNLQIQREYLAVTEEELVERADDAVRQAQGLIVEMLRRRFEQCRQALDTLTTYGAQTAEEQEDKAHLLHEHWALSRALEASS